jgi:sec-independent protein translocase protein TatA
MFVFASLAAPIFAMLDFAPSHMFIVAIVALLLFGDRLPSVMRSLGKGVVEFKKGMRGIEDQLQAAMNKPEPSPPRYREIEEREEPTAPRFEPPAAEPRVEAKAEAAESPVSHA